MMFFFVCAHFQGKEQGHIPDLGSITALEQDRTEIYFVHCSSQQESPSPEEITTQHIIGAPINNEENLIKPQGQHKSGRK